jgi:hypothetical protein
MRRFLFLVAVASIAVMLSSWGLSQIAKSGIIGASSPPGSSWINVQTDLGAKGDCSTDDTPAFQAYFTNYGTSQIPSGTALIVPNPSAGGCYKLTASLSIPQDIGFNFLGTSRAYTTLQMFTANTPMFVFLAENTHSFRFSDLNLTYSSPQTASADPLSIFFYLNPSISTHAGIYDDIFERINLNNGYRGWSIASVQEPFWGTVWRDILVNVGQSGAAISLNPSNPSIGQERNIFQNMDIRSNTSVSGDPQFRLYYCSSCIMDNISLLSGTNKVADLENNSQLSIRQLHIESHTFTQSTSAVDLSNSWLTIDGLLYGGTVPASTTDYLTLIGFGNGSVSYRNVYLAPSLGTSAAMSMIHGTSLGTYTAYSENVQLLNAAQLCISGDPACAVLQSR